MSTDPGAPVPATVFTAPVVRFSFRNHPESNTYPNPPATCIPAGFLNEAPAPTPSATSAVPLPANVPTAAGEIDTVCDNADGCTRTGALPGDRVRMRVLVVSVAYRRVPSLDRPVMVPNQASVPVPSR